jgi:ABC-type branched-subunit amino acid transport system substrate-binding protein
MKQVAPYIVGRRNILHGVMMGGALLMAGCTVIPKGPPKSVDVPPEDKPLPPGLPSDGQRHRVALLVPMTGPTAGVGESIANAANMAVLDTGGQKIRLTVYDTTGGVVAAATKAIADGNKLILGPLLGEDVKLVSAIGKQAKVPLLSFSNDASVAGNGTYIMGFTPAQSMARIVAFARTQGKRRFSAMAPVGAYGERALAAFETAVEAGGGTMLATQSYDRNSGGIIGAVARINRAGPADAILIADNGRVALQAVPLLRRNGNPNAQILGTELWNTDASLPRVPLMHGAWFASVSDGVFSQLSTKYRTRFGKAPFRLASLGYDAILLVTKVSVNWKMGTSFPLQLLEDRGGFAGIDGALRFSPNGIAERALEVQQISPTGAKIISAAPKVFSD